MKVYFLRHGVACDPAQWQGDDFDRPLTDDGIQRMKREAKALAKLDLALDAIVTSPLVRAKQTATIVAERLDLAKRLVEDERVGPGFSAVVLAAVLNDHADAGAIVLVGHEPSMSQTIGQLIGGARIDLKKGGVACVDVPEPSSLAGELLWLITPKILTAR